MSGYLPDGIFDSLSTVSFAMLSFLGLRFSTRTMEKWVMA
jgi:hypothetical protein